MKLLIMLFCSSVCYIVSNILQSTSLSNSVNLCTSLRARHLYEMTACNSSDQTHQEEISFMR
jgi:hypothetical protein